MATIPDLAPTGTLPPHDARSAFRATVAEVAARAKAILPQAVNGRVERAVKLVLGHDVTPQADGTIEVGSSTDPLKVYHLVGTTCDCQDFTQGKAPDGWCAHRIAAGIQKRVRELVPQAPPVEPWPDNDPEPEAPAPAPVPPAPLPEAPASVNVRLQIAGREVQWTLRDTDEDRLAERLARLLRRYPVPQVPVQPERSEGWCAVHDLPMRWNAGKDGRKGWFSHRDADGAWCKGRTT